MPTGNIAARAGAHDVIIDGAIHQVIVPTLTAGSVVQGSGVVGAMLTVTGSNASPTGMFQWQRDGVDIDGATFASHDTAGTGVGDYRRAVSDGVQGPVYTATVAVMDQVVEPTANVMTHLGQQQYLSALTTTPSTSVDVTGRLAGDVLIFAHGSSSTSTTATVAGNAATKVNSWNFGSGGARRGTLFAHVLQQADIDAGTIPVAFTVPAGNNGPCMVDFVASPGKVIAGSIAFDGGLSASVTTTQAENGIYHFVFGERSVFSGAPLAYTDGQTERQFSTDFGGFLGGAAGMIQNAPVGTNTLTWTVGGIGAYSGITVVVE